ncbi:hypothetical protein M569_16987 [Genlisea aurea]|uniref:Uncharacterized protein n=1 Tax=Genlisea aurea TaxID=192259 RepID=S8C0B7_9LAMI|nr:hypothetical protein M569_16987 [Genlisea aurea]
MAEYTSRRKKPSIGIASCFGGGGASRHRRSISFDVSSSSNPTPPRRSPKGKRRSTGLVSCMSRHRRHSSADFEFSYDPLSYALNFEDETLVADISGSMNGYMYGGSPRNHNLPKSPTPKSGGNSLRRGFEALSLNMNRRKASMDAAAADTSPEDAATVISPPNHR